jgi:hypothetical protein
MGKFLLYIFKILFFSFLVALFIQYLADSGLKKISDSIYADWNKILGGQLNSDLLILGSSRGYVSYDPRIIQKTTGLSSFNLSINAGSYNLQRLKLESYLVKNRNPKVIIQNIDLTHLSKSNYIPDEFQFLPYLNNQKLAKELSAINSDYRWNNYIPLFKYNPYKSFLVRGLCSFFGLKYSILPTIKGFAPKNPLFKKDKHNLKRLRELRSDSSNIQLFRKKLVITKEFLLKYKTDSVKIFLVWAPEYKERLDIITSIVTPVKEDIVQMVSDMPGVYFLDFSEDPMSLKKEYFYDTFHLNEKGAMLFSTKLSIEIDKILKN